MINLDFSPAAVARHVISLLNETEKNLHLVKNFLDPKADTDEITESLDKIAAFRSKIAKHHKV